MKIGVSMFLSAETNVDTDRALEHVLALGRKAEQAGLGGVWATDSLGRGKPTLDPLVALAALCGVTQRIEIGTCVLQVTLRPPAELAHRVQTLNVLSRGRLRLGVGVGSTRADFEVAGAEFEHRFERLESTLDIMRGAWRGTSASPANAALSRWPGLEQGPPVFLGAWRKPAWITFAARRCHGWIASGMKSKWRDVEEGMRVFRAAQGKRAILANVPTDLAASPAPGAGADGDAISLVCSAPIARERLRRLEQLGFDDILLACPFGSTTHMDMIVKLARSL
jgi:alkanesulfonate monooxygenase SsuD/methylene tetrahydromethanopterin reductase-like flavin-dependent oxidoreductase (luciferase family)